jgi:hypothetical protein
MQALVPKFTCTQECSQKGYIWQFVWTMHDPSSPVQIRGCSPKRYVCQLRGLLLQSAQRQRHLRSLRCAFGLTPSLRLSNGATCARACEDQTSRYMRGALGRQLVLNRHLLRRVLELRPRLLGVLQQGRSPLQQGSHLLEAAPASGWSSGAPQSKMSVNGQVQHDAATDCPLPVDLLLELLRRASCCVRQCFHQAGSIGGDGLDIGHGGIGQRRLLRPRQHRWQPSGGDVWLRLCGGELLGLCWIGLGWGLSSQCWCC